MKVKEFKTKLDDMNIEEMKSILKDNKEELFNLRFQTVTGHLEDTSRIRQVRKSIARIKTKIREKELLTLREEGS